MNLIKRERHVTAAQKNLIKSLHVSGIVPRQQMNIFGKMHGGEEQGGFNAQHLRNVVRDFRKDNLGVNDTQAGLDLLHRLEEESGGNFFNRTLIDEEGRLKCLLWVGPRSLLAYKKFGDVVAFDTIYRTNRYVMPFLPFTGVNHRYQSILFGFALMRDELKTTFEWVLGTWLETVEGKAPLAIITDQDQAMAGEIQSQLSNTTHLLCSWHITNKFPVKLSTYYAKEEFKGDFNNYIYHSLTEEIFEDMWKPLILKYKLEDWSCTGLKEFVEGAQKTTLEQHAASIYMKEMFKKFQDKLVEAAKYFVEKDRGCFLEDVEDTMLSIRACHVVIYCRVSKRCVVELPEHFVKRRWTRDANKVNGVLPYHMPVDDASSHDLTPTERFNHMTLLTIGFSHSCMASKERYEYAVRVIN
ncbi:protein FAR1-RELATED SEQUENCE 5-like [Apium graveolens]|uniref:protein FAR1-RELATED SEQUENCE 5-like n=1 Tax=Apium graveolens TaxID=4045 RepID=UPI003D7BCB97